MQHGSHWTYVREGCRCEPCTEANARSRTAAAKTYDQRAMLPTPPGQRNPVWMDLSLCASVDTDMFFPEQGGSTAHAKQVCALCPVRDECLSYALTNGERYGIWGGLSEQERAAIEGRRLKQQIRRDVA